MEFATPDDQHRAMLATVLYVPHLIRAFEANLEAAGFAIVARRHEHSDGHIPTPILVLRRDGLDVEMHLGNSIEDFLFEDREAALLRTDPNFGQGGYALTKLADVVEARIEVLEIALLPDGEERERRLREIGKRFEWLRITRIGGES